MEALPLNFFYRPAEMVGPELVGCRLVKRQDNGSLLWRDIEIEAYSQHDPPVMATAAVHHKTKPFSVSQGGSMCMSVMASTTA